MRYEGWSNRESVLQNGHIDSLFCGVSWYWVSPRQQLNVKHEPLSLIPPQFVCPLPPLQPAVFPPTMREPPPPALDQVCQWR